MDIVDKLYGSRPDMDQDWLDGIREGWRKMDWLDEIKRKVNDGQQVFRGEAVPRLISEVERQAALKGGGEGN